MVSALCKRDSLSWIRRRKFKYCLQLSHGTLSPFCCCFQRFVSKNRFHDDHLNGCLMSVDGTDFRIQQWQPWSKGWYSKKFNAPGLQYKIGVCILTGWIVWLHGPFPREFKNNLMIFWHSLASQLQPKERVECDKGYHGEPQNSKTPDVLDPEEVARIWRHVGQQHETINKQFKQFKCFKGVWRHSI